MNRRVKSFIGILSLLITFVGLYIAYLAPVFEYMVYSKEVESFTAIVASVDSHVKRVDPLIGSKYYAYFTTVTAHPTDTNYPGTITIHGQSRSENEHKKAEGSTITVYTYAGKYAFSGEDLFKSEDTLKTGRIIFAIGVVMLLISMGGSLGSIKYR